MYAMYLIDIKKDIVSAGCNDDCLIPITDMPDYTYTVPGILGASYFLYDPYDRIRIHDLFSFKSEGACDDCDKDDTI